MKPEQVKALKEARRRYQNAKRRALYWSGNPSFTRPSPSAKSLNSGNMDCHYELAMCDCKSWERTLERMTGAPVPHFDPKQEFREKFSRIAFKTTATPPP